MFDLETLIFPSIFKPLSTILFFCILWQEDKLHKNMRWSTPNFPKPLTHKHFSDFQKMRKRTKGDDGFDA